MTGGSLLLLVFFTKAQNPVADFTSNTVSGCAPLVVTFKDQSTGSPAFWNWDLGNGQLSNLQNPTAVYNTPGTYSVTLVVKNSNGTNGITKTNYITVNPSPKANFVANITTACLPATVQFTDLSTPNGSPITEWKWDFGDGTTSTQQNPQKTYTNVGFYSVSLRVTSSTGCVNGRSRGRYIRIVSGVTADFDFAQPATCKPPLLTSFTNLTNGPGNITYQWDFGNSTGSTQLSPIANYAAAGTYTVQLTARSEFGCAGVAQKSITINGNTTTISSPDSICLFTSVNFQNASTPAPVSSIWNFGNGRTSTNLNDTSSYSIPGTYSVKLINTYASCKDSITKNIYVRPKPVVDFTASSLMGCKTPFSVNFQDLSPDAVSWQWNFGDGGTSTSQNPSYQYNAGGNYNVTLIITSSSGCKDTITKTGFIRILKPVIAFTNVPAGGCAPFSFAPRANVNAIDGVASYFWDYGDGFTSTAAIAPAHSYAGIGSYTVRLIITTNGGCTDSLVVPNGVKVGTTPGTVDFSATPIPVCAFDTVSFTDLSTGTIDTWQWNLGDGFITYQRNRKHAYTDTGSYNIKLTIYNNGCGQSISKPGYIRVLAPVPGFSYALSSCNNKLQVSFTDTSKVDPSLGAPVYSWNFGDGSPPDPTQNPVHSFLTLGNYTVSLTVTNGSCSHTYSKTIDLVGDIADFSISKPTACKNDTIILTAINSDPAHIATYEWSINGGPFTAGPRSINVNFPAAGSYGIALRTTDINGCSNMKPLNNAITITGPAPSFTAAKGACSNAAVTFNDASTGGIQKWTWDFGDGNMQTFTASPFTHTYADTGRYTVMLTVQDNIGCFNSYTLPASIRITNIKAGFSADFPIVCPGVNVSFKNLSSDTVTTTGLWDFGDGNTSSLITPTHTYAGNDSVYTVKLLISDSTGCRDSVTKTNYISTKKPKAAFDAVDTLSICQLLETKFTFKGTDYESLLWDFGDGSTSTLTDLRHFYNTYGTYTAKLYLIGYGGCLDSASKTINVYNPLTTTSLAYNPLTACNSLLVDFTITPTPNIRFTFFAGDGFTDTTQATSFQHLYSTIGFFAPFVVLRDQLNCQVQVGGPKTIRIIGAIPLFGMDKKTFCDTGTTLFANYTIANDPIVSNSWDFGDGTTSTLKDPSHTFTQPGTYSVALNATTETGCSRTLTDTVRVYGTPNPTIIGDTAVCINEILNLQGTLARPDTAITWAWAFGNGNGSGNQNPSVSYGSEGTYNIQLKATNKLGCSGSTGRNELVPPIPAVNVAADPVIPVGTGITLPVTYGPNIAIYNWIPSAALSCIDCPTPFANPKYTTKYHVSVEDIYGCTNAGDITVTVVCNDKNFFIPNTFSPNNDGNNDVFYPRGTALTRIQSLRIFNRWGELVFERRNFPANDASLGWNGTYKGKPAPQDVYVYSIEFICDNAAIIPFKGNITLIR